MAHMPWPNQPQPQRQHRRQQLGVPTSPGQQFDDLHVLAKTKKFQCFDGQTIVVAHGVGFVDAPRPGPQEVPGRLSRLYCELMSPLGSLEHDDRHRLRMADLAIRRPGTS